MSIRTRARRAGVLLAGGALAASGLSAGLGLAGPAPVAHAADVPSPEAKAVSAWLQAQLADGLLAGNIAWTADLGLSALASGTDTPELLAQLNTGLDARHADILSGAPVTAAEVVAFQAQSQGEGADADLVQVVAGATDDTTGAFTDGQAWKQVWAVSALQAAGNAEAAKAAAFLRADQCATGAWGWGTACDGGTDYDTTARGVLALLPFADEDPAAQTAVDDAVTWLEGELAADGGIGESMYTPINTQSTGLVAWALGAAGSALAPKAASYVAGRQLVKLTGCASPLDVEHGAIAYSDDDVTTARKDGKIDAADRGYQWIWPSAQALAGLAYLSNPVTGRVTGPTGYVHAGTTVAVKVTGLRSSQPACLSGFGTTRRVAGPLGTTVKLPASTGNRVLALRWLGGTTATTTIKALAAKTFRPVLRSTTVARGGTQVVAVSGLAPGERFVVAYAGRQVGAGTATSKGAIRVTFAVGRTTGVKSVVVRGQFSDRRGSTTFRVR